MLRISDTSMITVYEDEGSIYLIRSEDNGESWSRPEVLFKKSSHYGKHLEYEIIFEDLMTQPDIIQLENGDLIAACSVQYYYMYPIETADQDTVYIEYPASILVKHISGGTIVEPGQVVYTNLGCQHPELLQLPDGSLQLYFTNGNMPITLEMINSTELSPEIKEQRIDMIESNDGGYTWTGFIQEIGPDGQDERWAGAKTVVSRIHKNNIGPSAQILKDEIVLAFADDKTVTFKPYIAKTAISNAWPYSINGDTPDRYYAFYELRPESKKLTMPTLLTVSPDVSLLSYDTNENRKYNTQTVEVVVSDESAKDFTKATRPFLFPDKVNAINNSLMQFDEKTIVAITSANYPDFEAYALWCIKGYLIDDLEISGSEIVEYPIFVGGLSASNVRVGLGVDASNLYISADVTDLTPIEAEPGTQIGDGVYFYIDAANLSLLDVDEGISKIWVSSNGDVSRWDGQKGRWVTSSADGIAVITTSTESGYKLDVTIPKSRLTNFNNSGIRFAVGLSDYSDVNEGTVELLSQCKDLRSSSWLGVTFK
jgi:hypothetical protein